MTFETTGRRVLIALAVLWAVAGVILTWQDAAEYRRGLSARPAPEAEEEPALPDYYIESAERRREALLACLVVRGESDPCGCREAAEEFLGFWSGARPGTTGAEAAQRARLLVLGC